MTAAYIQNKCFDNRVVKTVCKMFTGLKTNEVKMYIFGAIYYA